MTAQMDEAAAAEDWDTSGLAYDPDTALSDLAAIAEDVREKVAEPTRLRHPGNPAYVLEFRSHVETSEAVSCEKRTKNHKAPVRDRNALLLAITNTGITKDGGYVENSKGNRVTFRDPEFQAAFKASTALDCAVQFLRANDGWIISMSDAVMTAAGYGTEVEVVGDPTDSA